MDDLIHDMLYNGEDDDALPASALFQVVPSVIPSTAMIACSLLDVDDNNRDHTGERSQRHCFDHGLTSKLIQDHYLGPTALHGSQFKLQFRVSLTTFQFILEKVMNSSTPFYKTTTTLTTTVRASNEAGLLLPLKTLSYVVCPCTVL